MRWLIVLLIILTLNISTATAQPPLAYIGGRWYNVTNGGACYIRQSGTTALFVNENGDRAWGEVYMDHVYIPNWTDGYGRPGLYGSIRGNRIIWPDGNYWER